MKKLKNNINKILNLIAAASLMAVTITNPGGIFLSLGDNSFASVLLILINLLLGIVGILSIAFIIYGGFQYIASGGDEERAAAGKKTLTNAIIGLVIVILSYVIVTVIINALSGKV